MSENTDVVETEETTETEDTEQEETATVDLASEVEKWKALSLSLIHI